MCAKMQEAPYAALRLALQQTFAELELEPERHSSMAVELSYFSTRILMTSLVTDMAVTLAKLQTLHRSFIVHARGKALSWINSMYMLVDNARAARKRANTWTGGCPSESEENGVKLLQVSSVNATGSRFARHSKHCDSSSNCRFADDRTGMAPLLRNPRGNNTHCLKRLGGCHIFTLHTWHTGGSCLWTGATAARG